VKATASEAGESPAGVHRRVVIIELLSAYGLTTCVLRSTAMKRLVVVLLILAASLSGCSLREENIETQPATSETEKIYQKAKPSEEIRAVWLTFVELSMKDENGGSASSFEKKISAMFDNIVSAGLNTVFVHVRPYSDAYYRSALFPWSAYFGGKQGKDPGYDPLEILVAQAQARELSLHAWINPFRVSNTPDISKLSADNPARIWLEDNNEENNDNVAVLDNGIYYNPTAPDVHKLVIDGVREILKNYEVDGIHIDDYFYPAQTEEIDARQYAAYKKEGGKAALGDWRRACVNTFISGMYSAVKSAGQQKIFSISPAGDIANNREQLYADVAEWVKTCGYTDYIIPQIYFGFENEYLPFQSLTEKWSSLCTEQRVKVIWGLAAYKCGSVDEYAGQGTAAKNEWLENDDILSRQIRFIRELPRYDGFSLFSYRYIFSSDNEISEKEIRTMLNML